MVFLLSLALWLLFVLAVLAPFVLAGLGLVALVRARILRRAARGVEGARFSRWGAQVEGAIDGVALVATPEQLRLAAPPIRAAILERQDLLEIAAGPRVASGALRPFAERDGGPAAAHVLLAHGGAQLRLILDDEKGELRTRALGRKDLAAAARALLTLAAKRPGAPVKAPARGVCPFCRDELRRVETEGTIRCGACETVHHAECWKEYGGCTIHGCKKAPLGREAERAGAVARARELARRGDEAAARAELDAAARREEPARRRSS